MDDTNTECEPKRENQLEDYSGSTHSLMVDDARSAFLQLENWMNSLDLKASIMIAINAISISSLEPTMHFSQQIPILKFLIIVFPFTSIILALCCLWPRSWTRPNGMNTIECYADKKFDYAASKLAKNYANGEKKLKEAYNDKFEYLQLSIICTVISLGLSFMLILHQIF